MPGAICAYTFSGGALVAGAALGRGVGVLVTGRRTTPATACRRGADVQALTSPDPQVNAANAVMTRLRVRT
jgi:hypothetical protein